MADKENKRKCLKCSRSPFQDNVKLFRFPKPALKNNLKCEMWASFMFPEDQRSASTDFQRKLYNEHRMLCNLHFSDAAFTDSKKSRLQRDACPTDNENSMMNVEHQSSQVGAGPSQPGSVPPQAEPSLTVPMLQAHLPSRHLTDRMPLKEVTNSTILISSAQPLPGTSKQTEKITREQTLKNKCVKYMRRICQLRNRIKNLKRKKIIEILSEDMAVKKISQKITPAFALLLQGQLRNCRKKATGRRWLKEEKITALRIYKRSPTCYRLLRRMFNLPSISTLKSVLRKVPFDVGINKAVFEVLKKSSLTQKKSDKEFTLMFDEMSLKKHLQYNSNKDQIEGFQDHASQGRSPLIAGYALVFMVAGIRQRVKQPIAHYFSSSFSTADRLVVLIKEVLLHCFEAGLNIAAIVCDMDGVNRRAMTILGATTEHPYIMVHDKEIVTLFDTPHLLKCFRNLWMKYDIECSTDISSDNMMGRGIAKWMHIEKFHELDTSNPNFVYCPTLKKDHINPNTKQKMKVNLAAQVLSHSVAGGIFAKIAHGELSTDAAVTANVCENMDKLFDAVNSDSSDLRRGKPFATNLRENTPHLEHFEKNEKVFPDLEIRWKLAISPIQRGLDMVDQ